MNKSEIEKQLTVVDGRLTIKEKPIEIFNGYFYIPGYSRYAISKNGIIMDLEMGDFIKPRYKGDDYPFVSVVRDGTTRQNTVDLHLLLMLAFKPMPDYGEKTEVNHIDMDRTNFSLDNLEWVTKTENYRHGVKNKIKNKSRDFVLIVTNLDTKEETRFTNVPNAAAFLEIKEGRIYKFLSESPEKQDAGYRIDNFILKNSVEEANLINTCARGVYVVDLVNDTVQFMKQISTAALVTGLSRCSVTESAINSRNRDSCILNGYRFYYADDIEGIAIRKLDEGELFFHKTMRFKSNKINNGRCYYIVDKKYDIAYPIVSLRSLVGCFQDLSYSYHRLGEMERNNFIGDRFEVYAIYERRGSSVRSQHYLEFIANFKGKFSEKIPAIFDAIIG